MPQTRDVQILKCCIRISPRILTTDPHPHSPHTAAAVCPVHLSLASWVTEEQLTAAAAEHGHWVTQIEHVRQHYMYTIASAYCAQQVSLPSAELVLMIRISPRPRIFGGEPSASVRGSQEFLRIGVRRRTRLSTGRRMRPPSTHLCRRPPWPSARRPRRVARRHDGHLMPPPHLLPQT